MGRLVGELVWVGFVEWLGMGGGSCWVGVLGGIEWLWVGREGKTVWGGWG